MTNLKKIRITRGMTQEQLAAAIGVTTQTIYYYESGQRTPNLETLRKLSEVLECTVDELIK